MGIGGFEPPTRGAPPPNKNYNFLKGVIRPLLYQAELYSQSMVQKLIKISLKRVKNALSGVRKLPSGC